MRWFQLYLWRDRGRAESLIDGVAEAGFRTLVLTVDVPVAGDRRRDVRNGLEIPPALRLATVVEGSLHPRWWFDCLTTEPIHFAVHTDPGETLQDVIGLAFNPAITMHDLAWLRDRWAGRLVVKGVMRVEDAREIVSPGVDGIVVSNHGGRQLDRSVTPLEALPSVVEAVGERVEVFVDGGIRSGADVIAAVGLGARAALVGRSYLYGLMAGGELGVEQPCRSFAPMPCERCSCWALGRSLSWLRPRLPCDAESSGPCQLTEAVRLEASRIGPVRIHFSGGTAHCSQRAGLDLPTHFSRSNPVAIWHEPGYTRRGWCIASGARTGYSLDGLTQADDISVTAIGGRQRCR